MVQVIRANPRPPRGPSTGQQIGEALSKAVSSVLEAYQRKQKQQEFEQGLTQAEKIFADPNLSPEQKQLGLFKALRNSPDVAKTLGSQLSGLGQQPLNPLQEAQRQKLLLEIQQAQEEDNYLNRLIGEGDQQPSTKASTPHGNYDLSTRPKREPSKEAEVKTEFDYKNPSSWSDSQVNQLRAIRGKTPKAQSLANMAQNEYDRRQETKKAKAKHQENVAPLHSALETIGRMESIGKKGNLGIGTKVRGVLSPQARREAAEYERLGKSLIQFSSNIPIRNRQEFEVLAHDLYDPSISDASREGILAALKRIIQSSMKQFEAPEEEFEARQPKQPAKKERPPLTSFLK